jgi:hypothetical protein
LAGRDNIDGLKKRYGDVVACYRLLAKEREWLISTGALEGEQPRCKVFWRDRNDYEWQVRDSDNVTIAKGRADSIAKAVAAGNKKAECLSKMQ